MDFLDEMRIKMGRDQNFSNHNGNGNICVS